MKGRYWVVFWLLAFLASTAAVAMRAQSGLTLARELSQLQNERRTLEAEKGDLERQLRLLTSRRVLGAVVRDRLGLLPPPSDSMIVVLCIADAGQRCPDAAP